MRPNQNQALLAVNPLVIGTDLENLEIRLPASLLERFTALLISSPELDVLLEELFAGVHDIFDIDFVALYTLEGTELKLLAAFGDALPPKQLERSEDSIWTVLDTAHPNFYDVSESNIFQASSYALIPLCNSVGAFGILVFGRVGDARAFSATRRYALIATTRVITIPIERLLSVQPSTQAPEASALLALSRLLEGVHNAAELERAALEVLRPFFAGASLGFAILEGQQLRFEDFEGHEDLAKQAGLNNWHELHDLLLLDALVSNTPSFIDDYALVSKHPYKLWLGAGIRSVAFVPILASNFGTDLNRCLCAFRLARERSWSQSEKHLLAAAGRTITVSLERIYTTQALREARARAEFLAALSDALQSVQTAEEVAETAMRLLAPALNAKNIIILKLEKTDGKVFLHSMGVYGDLPEAYSGYFQKPGVLITATVLSKEIVETRQAHYDTTYNDQIIPDMRSRQVSIGIEPVKAEDGQVIALLSVGRDTEIGEWRDGERDLMARAAATIGLALERAHVRDELEAQNLALAEKSAEMESFVYSVSHDLKAPMVSLEGMSTLLEENLKAGDTSELEFFVSRLRANVNTMTALVNGLLELSRIGRVDETVDAVEVEKIIAVVLGELESQMKIKNLNLITASNWPIMTFSPERMYQLWANLIGNAVKFSKPNTDIQLNWEKTDTTIEFSVSDNGVGIPDLLKNKALDLFSRLNPSIEGTGVGLAMVKRILEISDGALRLEDTPGGGLTVVFAIALGRAQYIPAS